MSLIKEGNQLASTLKLSPIHDPLDSSFEKKFSLLLMDNSFCDDSDAQAESNINTQSCFKPERILPKYTPSNNIISSKGAANPKIKPSKSQIGQHNNKCETPNCYPNIINYNLYFSQSQPIQVYNQPMLQQPYHPYSKAYLTQNSRNPQTTFINPLSPSLIYQSSYNNNVSTSREVLNMFDYFYKAFSMGQLTSFLCNSQTCTADSIFKKYVKGLSQPASDELLEMILLSGGLEKIMTSASSSKIVRSLLQTCSSSSRYRIACSLGESLITISQALIGSQNLIILIKSLKSLNEISLMQKLLSESAHTLSTHKISYLIVIQFLASVCEPNRQILNKTLLNLFPQLVLHKYGIHVVSLSI